MARARFVVCCALALAACAHGAAPSPSGPSTAPVPELPQRVALSSAPRGDDDWKALGDEAAQLLAQYLRINTTNPPGHERRTADWLAAVLAREGIAAQVFEPAPGKANLYARLGGDGSARPIILLNHMDVVLASPEYWSVDPFGGLIRDGYIWGRGAQDMKGEGIAELMTLVVLKRVGVPLKRDVIFLATADEEVGQGVGGSRPAPARRASRGRGPGRTPGAQPPRAPAGGRDRSPLRGRARRRGCGWRRPRCCRTRSR